MYRNKILTIIAILSFSIGVNAQSKTKEEQNYESIDIHMNKYKQTVWGMGFEIQCDAIGSGNTSMPDEMHSVPHDLIPSERKRFAEEMLSGFRYCRLAGGLYWRGLDSTRKYLLPRWPNQLGELRQVLDLAGVEGVSLEYWSPPPYWKANSKYVGKGSKDKNNTLRCFGPNFAKDPIYKGDTARFLKEYGKACVKDIKTLKDAGINTVQWGMSNEPFTNNSRYSSCKFFKASDYVRAYVASAGAVRKLDSTILLISDTETGYPRKIATGMHNPKVASLVDAYVVHTIGWDSERVRSVHKKIKESLPKRPWFQNEYEYLKGGASPERCLNIVQHIMNSFQLGENPTWYWIHALKPFKNSEASGYSLGFWKSKMPQYESKNINKYERWVKGDIITKMPDKFKQMEYINAIRFSDKKPGVSYNFVLNQAATAYMLVDQIGNYKPKGWVKTKLKINRSQGNDIIYTKKLKKGYNCIPEHIGKEGKVYGAPNALFLQGDDMKNFNVQIGVNSPMKIRSKTMALELKAAKMKPGTWIYNDFNWNAVGSFVKHMPWNSRVIDITEKKYNKDARVLVFKRPNGKRTIVVSNRTKKDFTFNLNTDLAASKWKGYKYTPWERGENTKGVEIGEKKGNLNVILPSLSWEFWEEQ